MLPKGPPRILKNCKKFVCAPLQNPPESPSRRDREKSGSRTVNTMVLARSTKCLQTFFFITFGLLLAPFLSLRGHANHPGAEKERSTKNLKKNISTTVSKCNRKTPKSRPNPDHFLHFLHALGLDRPRDRPGGPEAPSEDYLGTHSHPTHRNLSRGAYRTCSMKWYNANNKFSR